MPQEQPEEFRLQDLFIDVKLEACVNGTTFDFLGRKLFSTQFFREGVGFGITNIDIEINTSLQPLVTIVFKDLYGLTVFGGQSRNPDEGQSHDYSVLFNWPPPKFLFSFKGYLGKAASWVLNLKRTSTSFNSSDGSYEIKCEFVPNQWGFFSDLPFLYLLAAKKLRKDKIGPDAKEKQLKNIISVFDLIKIGKQIEIKSQETTKEFDDLSKQIGSLKSNIAKSIVTNIVSEGDIIEGVVNNQKVKDFIKIEIPRLVELDVNINTKEKIDVKLGDIKELTTLNTYILLSIKINGVNSFSKEIAKDYTTFRNNLNTAGGNKEIDNAKKNVLNTLEKNLEFINLEIKRRVFFTSESKLEKITIGEVFSQLAKDSGFIMGSILDAGLDGYRGDSDRQKLRDSLSNDLIGESFPMIIKKEDGEEVPATEKNFGTNIGVDAHEMDFVKRFINAITEGIATDLLANNPQNGEDDSILKQRINNMEMSSQNPYKPNYQNIATNILVRGGIVAYFTRSDDPNLPGDFAKKGDFFDRDDLSSIQEIAERDMQNLSDNIIKNLSDIDFLLLKRFATFFSRYFTSDLESIALASSKPGIESTGFSFAGGNMIKDGTSSIPNANPLNWKVILTNQNQFNINDTNPLDTINSVDKIKLNEFSKNGVEYTTFQQIWNELSNESLLQRLEIVGNKIEGFTEIEDFESQREDQEVSDVDTKKDSAQNINTLKEVKNAQNPLSFVETTGFTATRIINNGIVYMYPLQTITYDTKGNGTTGNTRGDKYYVVLFEDEDHQRALEANTAPTDSEFKPLNKDDIDFTDFGQKEVTGYIPINSKYGEDGKDTKKVGDFFKLKRVVALEEYRDIDNVFEFKKCKNPGPNFYNGGVVDLKWRKILLENSNENTNSTSPDGETIVGKIGYTVCAHISDATEDDAGFVFGLFNFTQQGRNQRAYIKKCAQVILDKIKSIEDERHNIIGQVLGKAGEQEDSIYKQMHTLFHQWQSLSYVDKIDAGGSLCGSVDENKSGEGGETRKVFDVATSLEKRFGDNHKNMEINEKIYFSKEEIIEGVDLTNEELQSLSEETTGPNIGKFCFSISDSKQSESVPDGTFIYDYPLQRINPTSNVVNVKNSIINLEPLYKPNANTTVLNIIQQICTKNNFLFIPIPGNPGPLDNKEIYKPSVEPANVVIKNFFHIIFTPTPESRTKTKNTNGTALADFSNQQKQYSANSFLIKYGHPDNQIVSNIQVGTEDNKVTAESIVNLQSLVDNENQNKKVTTDCSMLPVLAGRSYKASVDMLGNAQVYPMQFFFLDNSPLFGGLYQVMKVKHSISPNDMKTSLDGIRMRFSSGNFGSISPITLETFKNLGESELPNNIKEGFDKEDRELIKNLDDGSLTDTSLKANSTDYINQDFVDGNKGGPVAKSILILPQNELDIYDKSLGVRDLWSQGKVIGSSQMYIIDNFPLTSQLLSAWKLMKNAANTDGVKLNITSGYRDPFRNIIDGNGRFLSTAQIELRKQNVKDKSKKNDLTFLKTAISSEFKPPTAKPGFSNHNSGLAIDLNCRGAVFGGVVMPIYEWLVLNAYKYGFVRTVWSEEWHWEYRPGKATFQFVDRDNPKNMWYGLPDKLGIPVNKPSEETLATTTLGVNIINDLESDININI